MSISIQSDDQRKRFAKPPMALLITVACVIVIEVGAANLHLRKDKSTIFMPAERAPTLVESIVIAKLQASVQPSEKTEILILGDSSGLMGVDARLLSQRTGKSSYNLCTISLMGVTGHLEFLKQYVTSHGKPDVLVYHYAPNELALSQAKIEKLKFLSSVQQWYELADNKLRVRPERKEVLPSQDFRKIAQEWLTIKESAKRFEEMPRGNWPSHEDLLRTLDGQHGYLGEISKDERTNPVDLELKLSDYQLESFHQLLDYTSQQGIQVCLVANPLPVRAATPATEQHNRLLRRGLHQALYSHVDAMDLFDAQRFYNNNRFATLTHLRPEASHQNTLEIADALMAVIGD